ncbi:MAG: hypothetical protein COB59_10745 [Rhodospirillaceae bacterium]|nr:MAG: hypothetical protein COB59_10745 [Rhodospirillaceae bacterium]
MTNKLKLTLLSGVAAFAASMMPAGQAYATFGMLPSCVGTEKCGMGGAGSAKAAAAVDAAMNPALAGKMGNEYQINLGWFWADVKGITTIGDVQTEMTSGAGDFPNGSLGVNYKIDDTTSFNISIVPGGGGASDWPTGRQGAGFPATKNEDQNVDYKMVYLQPSVSYKYDAGTTLGIGAILSRATMDTDSAQGSFQPSGVEGVSETFYGVGFQVGAVWDLPENGSFAVSLRSPVWHQDTGVYDNVVFTDPIDTPAQALLGLTFDVTPSTSISLDYKYVAWSSVATIGNSSNDPTTASRGFGWVDQNIFMIGVEHKIDDSLQIRAGVSHANSPIDEGHVLANFLFPAIVETHFTAGATYTMGNGMKLGASGYITPTAKKVDDLSVFGAANGVTRASILKHQQKGFQLSVSQEF